VSSAEERLHCHIPTELKERMDSSDEAITQQVVEALEIYFGEEQTGNRAAVERQIQRYQEQKARGRQMVQDGESMARDAEAGISRLKQRLEQMEASDRSYTDDLDSLLAHMKDEEMAVFADHESVKRIAREHNKTTSTVLDDLQSRSELNGSYFTEGKVESPDDSGLNYDWGN